MKEDIQRSTFGSSWCTDSAVQKRADGGGDQPMLGDGRCEKESSEGGDASCTMFERE
jgi:hypothetical protein